MSARPAIFVDRDGTLIEEVDHLSRVEDMRLFPFTAEAIGLLKAAGYYIIVVTNQSGIARNFFNIADVDAIHERLQQELSNAIDGFYYCPHMPDAGCRCRKPSTGMIDDANRDLEIDLKRSWMIGDKLLDAATGLNAGTQCILVRTGYGRSLNVTNEENNTIVVDDLLAAAKLIVNGG